MLTSTCQASIWTKNCDDTHQASLVTRQALLQTENHASSVKHQASSVNFRRIVNVLLQFFESTLYVHSLDPVCSIMRFKIF